MITTGVAAVAVLACGGWLAYTTVQVHSDLLAASEQASVTKAALLDGDTATAQAALGRVQEHASTAAEATHSFPWTVAENIPFVGGTFDAVQQIADVVRDLGRDVLPSALEAGSALEPRLLVGSGGRVNLDSLSSALPALDASSAAAQEISDRTAGIEASSPIGAVEDAGAQLQDQVRELSGILSNTRTAAQLLPQMLGGDGDRSYFLAFQTNAEARGTGGLMGGFAVLRAEDGSVRVDELAANKEISLKQQPIDLGSDYSDLYGRHRPTTDWRNANLSPHFPYAGRIWQSIWAQESGSVVDGVLATDPVALSYVLGAIGPIKMADGEVVDADNVVELTESTAYIRFADDNAARKAYLQELAARVVAKITGDVKKPTALLEALGRAVSERRIAVWSTHPEEQEVIAQTPLGHTVPDDPAPYANVIVNNAAGNKLDYYLTRDISYTAESCDADTRKSTVTVALGNDTPDAVLPDYVAGMVDNNTGAEAGTARMLVSLYGTQGATLKRASGDNGSLFALAGREQGRPVYTVDIQIPRGQTRTVTFELTEPTAAGPATVPVQPLVAPVTVTTDVPVCD
ncbi:DUF4012 domain-containing protein [Prescottella defluvii]|uniref:DUF4012 domain-containing protein n=1 Tax=Prescottella defluvii TaxID=1323361 RepID=UPI001E58F33A|nr:DUF4012 domain-containing protein [Prescottella defluvii]